MAYEMKIRGTQDEVKVRNLWAVALLPIITLGIYHFVWWYKINKEMVELGRAKGTGELGDNPTTSLLALVPGFLIIVPPLVSYYKGTQRMQAAARITGAEPVNGWIALIIFVVIGIAFAPFLQSNLNKVWDAQAGGGAAAAIPAADAAALPAEPAAPAEQPPPPPPPPAQ